LTELYMNKKWSNQATNLPLDKINSLLQALNNNILKWWTVEEMAEFCELSKNHFRRIFIKKTGMNPKSYIEKLKIRRASESLCSSDISVAKVAKMLNYNDPYHFSRVFKKNTGLAPGYYRKKYTDNPEL